MALPTLLLAVVLLGAYALYQYRATSRRHRVPKGLKALPGPKGMTMLFLEGNSSELGSVLTFLH
jgi:hypothetical protein